MEITSYFIMKKKVKKTPPLLSTFQLSSVSKDTKKYLLIRILNIWGTFWFMVYPFNLFDVSESWFRFFILRMRLNNSKGILWAHVVHMFSATRSLHEDGTVRTVSMVLRRCVLPGTRIFFVLFCFDKA